jgi:hypothetical protein
MPFEAIDTFRNGFLDSAMAEDEDTDCPFPTAIKLEPRNADFLPPALPPARPALLLRRRGSDSSSASNPSLKVLFMHPRSQTKLDGGKGPLGSPSTPLGLASITRPHLTRIVGASEVVDGSQPENDEFTLVTRPPTPESDERVVLVHEVCGIPPTHHQTVKKFTFCF